MSEISIVVDEFYENLENLKMRMDGLDSMKSGTYVGLGQNVSEALTEYEEVYYSIRTLIQHYKWALDNSVNAMHFSAAFILESDKEVSKSFTF